MKRGTGIGGIFFRAGTILSERMPDESVPIEDTEYWRTMEKNRAGNLLAGARLKAGLTQAQLAERVGIRQSMVSDYERGRRGYSDDMARRLSKVLKVREEHLRYRNSRSADDDDGLRQSR